MVSFLVDLKATVMTYENDIPRLIQLVFILYGKIWSCIWAAVFYYVKND